jgi:hypothetical protein
MNNYADVLSRLSQLQHDLREAAGDHAWGHPQALNDLYQRLWNEAKEAMGVEPPVPSRVEGQFLPTADYGMMFTVSALVLAGQLQTWLGKEDMSIT